MVNPVIRRLMGENDKADRDEENLKGSFPLSIDLYPMLFLMLGGRILTHLQKNGEIEDAGDYNCERSKFSYTGNGKFERGTIFIEKKFVLEREKTVKGVSEVIEWKKFKKI